MINEWITCCSRKRHRPIGSHRRRPERRWRTANRWRPQRCHRSSLPAIPISLQSTTNTINLQVKSSLNHISNRVVIRVVKTVQNPGGQRDKQTEKCLPSLKRALAGQQLPYPDKHCSGTRLMWSLLNGSATWVT